MTKTKINPRICCLLAVPLALSACAGGGSGISSSSSGTTFSPFPFTGDNVGASSGGTTGGSTHSLGSAGNTGSTGFIASTAGAGSSGVASTGIETLGGTEGSTSGNTSSTSTGSSSFTISGNTAAGNTSATVGTHGASTGRGTTGGTGRGSTTGQGCATLACPEGFTCQADGDCGGGNLGTIDINVPTVSISGSFTVNGKRPTVTQNCDSYDPTQATATVTLVETTHGYTFYLTSVCSDSTFSFSGTVFPGVYSATVSGQSTYSNVPGAGYVANPAVVITSDTTGLVLNVPTVAVSGSVTVNGATPAVTQNCDSYDPSQATSTVTLRETTYGYTFYLTSVCSDPTFSFSGTIYPGTYSATVSGASDYSNVPGAGYVANPSVAIHANTSGLSLDAPTVSVSGSVTVNGQQPMATSNCDSYDPSQATSTVTLRENTYGYTFYLTSVCSDPTFSFSGTVFPGTYTATVSGSSDYSNVPGAGFVANPAVVISANTAGPVLNVPTVTVAGKVTVNSQKPTVSSNCDSYDPSQATSTVTLRENTYGYTFYLSSVCSDPSFSFSGTVFPGTYTATVSGSSDYSNVPGAGFVANPAVVISADTAALVFNVPTRAVSGSVTVNGAGPMTTQNCDSYDPSQATSTVTLHETAYGYTFYLTTVCSDPTFSFSGTVFPGTYTATVSGSASYSNVPGAGFVANPSVSIQSNLSGLVLNVPTVTIGGNVTVNGAQPSLTQNCDSYDPSQSTSTVTFTEVDRNYTFYMSSVCSDPTFGFSGSVYPGTYKVTVDGSSDYSDVPGASYTAIDRLEVGG